MSVQPVTATQNLSISPFNKHNNSDWATGHPIAYSPAFFFNQFHYLLTTPDGTVVHILLQRSAETIFWLIYTVYIFFHTYTLTIDH